MTRPEDEVAPATAVDNEPPARQAGVAPLAIARLPRVCGDATLLAGEGVPVRANEPARGCWTPPTLAPPPAAAAAEVSAAAPPAPGGPPRCVNEEVGGEQRVVVAPRRFLFLAVSRGPPPSVAATPSRVNRAAFAPRRHR